MYSVYCLMTYDYKTIKLYVGKAFYIRLSYMNIFSFDIPRKSTQFPTTFL